MGAHPPVGAANVLFARVRLTWTDNSRNETGFRISRCVGLDCDDILVGANVTTYDDKVCGGPSTVLEMGQALLIIQPECVTL